MMTTTATMMWNFKFVKFQNQRDLSKVFCESRTNKHDQDPFWHFDILGIFMLLQNCFHCNWSAETVRFITLVMMHYKLQRFLLECPFCILPLPSELETCATRHLYFLWNIWNLYYIPVEYLKHWLYTGYSIAYYLPTLTVHVSRWNIWNTGCA